MKIVKIICFLFLFGVFFLTADPIVLTNGGYHPVVSRDDSLLLYVEPNAESDLEIKILTIATGETRVLDISLEGDFDLCISPDKSKIAFDVYSSKDSKIQQIFIYDLDVGSYAQISTNGGFQPVWSPDGEKIAYIRDKIYVYNIETATTTMISVDTSGAYCPNWSPDSKSIVFSKDMSGEGKIFIKSIENLDEPAEQITFGNGNDFRACWSADGSKIVFTSNRGGNHDIWVVHLSDGHYTQVTDTIVRDGDPYWFTRSNNIAYITGDPPGDTAIVMFDYDELKIDSISDSFFKNKNYPNPFNPSTVIEFELPCQSEVMVQVYNAKGEIIKDIYKGAADMGKNSFEWDGKDRYGKNVSSGTYFYKILGDDINAMGKMLMVK